MSIRNIDGYLGSTMQEIFTFVAGYAHMRTTLNVLLKIFRRHSFYKRLESEDIVIGFTIHYGHFRSFRTNTYLTSRIKTSP